ncbi:MAG: HAD-IA family hydrolase [Oscillospiraceae bacterium]|nr:HAD-IA family hydrolase [Oscillospiraceae bacterium]
MSYKAVIFDLDGTILDTLQDLANSLNYALTANGYPARTLDEVRRFIGNGVRMLVRRGCPEGTAEEAQEVVFNTFLPHYDVHCKDLTGPYEGIHELLDALLAKGIRTAVVSNKIEPAVIVLCDEHFPGQFEYMVGNRPDIAPKPSPDSVNEVIAKMGIDRSDIVYIGDTEVDLQTAANAGIDCIGVDWGFRDGEYLRELGAKYVVYQPAEILKIVI